MPSNWWCNRRVLGALGLFLLTACSTRAEPDTYGNFEADETVVAAEVGGQLHEFLPVEGEASTADTPVGRVDTVQMSLERDQLLAQRAGIVDHRQEVTQQIRTLHVQLEIAQRSRERTDRLFAQQAATSVQRDQNEREVRVLTEQIAGTRLGVGRVTSELASIDARIAAVNDRIRRATITSPISGTVLAIYVRSGEFIQPGQQLYRVANLDTLTLRAYVTGTQLTSFRIGQRVQVHVDGADKSLRTLPGTVTWVSSRAEFTPTPIQTRDDRGDLVYAIKVRVANANGALKIGMPGDVTLAVGPVPAPSPDKR